MRCGTARVFIQETLDGPLSPPDEAMLEAHLGGCEACQAYRHAISRVAASLGDLQPVPAPRDFGASVRFQIGRERTRSRLVPVVAAAAFMVGFLIIRPHIGQSPLKVASEVAVPVAAGVAPGSAGGMLDAVSEQPVARSLEAARAPEQTREIAPLARPAEEREAPITIAAAPPPRGEVPARPESQAAPPRDLDAAAPPAGLEEAKKEEAPRDVASLDEAGTGGGEGFMTAVSPAGADKARSNAGAGAVRSLPAAPAPRQDDGEPSLAAAAAAKAYKVPASRRARAAVRRSPTPAEQLAIDRATFEILRWMDPAADGGPDLELQEVDFTLP